MSDTTTNTGSAIVIVSPGGATPVTVDADTTVADVLRQAGTPTEGMQYRISGEQVSLDRRVRNGEKVIVTRQIKGN